jgi:superfamily II DNA or RNA helicase
MKKIILSDQLYIPNSLVKSKHRRAYTTIIGEEGYTVQAFRKGEKKTAFCRGNLEKLYRVFSDLVSEAKDRRAKPAMEYDLSFTGKLWANQKNTVKEWLRYRYGQLKAPARSGKTVMACYISCKLGVKTLILAHQKELLDQYLTTFEKHTNLKHIRRVHGKPIVGILKRIEWSKINQYDVILATYQSIMKDKGWKVLQENSNSFGLVAIDECSLCASHYYRKVINKINSYYRLGVTATPIRKDELHVLSDEIIGPVTSIGKADSMICKVTYVRTNHRVLPFSWWTTFINNLCKNEKRNKLIVDYALKDVKAGYHVLIVSDRVNHIKYLAKLLNSKGIPTGALHGQSDRDRILAQARKGTLKVTVASRKLAKFGLDVPMWSAYYNVCPMAFEENYYQECSRVRTPYEGKPQPIIRYFLDTGHKVVYACLHYRSKVNLANGRKKNIGTIVNNKDKYSIQSFNIKTNKLESKPVIGWVRNSIKGHRWYFLSYKYASKNYLRRDRGVFLTEDHEVFTQRGKVRVDSLRKDDRILTTEKSPNSKQKELYIGTMLGDSYIPIKNIKNRAGLSSCHGELQKKWIELKRDSLEDLGIKPLVERNRKNKLGTVSFSSTASAWFTEQRNRWYPKGKKIVPKDLSPDEFSWLTLAAWYTDDGYLHGSSAGISSESFSKKNNELLAGILRTKFGIMARVKRKVSRPSRKLHYFIYIGNGNNGENSANRFFRGIAPYIIESMRYKLPEEIRNSIKFKKSLWNLGHSEPYYAEPIVEKQDPTKGKNWTYCLEVKDNHNFTVSNIVLSNCKRIADRIHTRENFIVSDSYEEQRELKKW